MNGKEKQAKKGYEYFKLVGLSVSPDNTMISFGVDTVGFTAYVGTYDYTSQGLVNIGDGSYWMMDNECWLDNLISTVFFV